MFCQKSALNDFLRFSSFLMMKNSFYLIKYLAEVTGLNDWLIFWGVGGIAAAISMLKHIFFFFKLKCRRSFNNEDHLGRFIFISVSTLNVLILTIYIYIFNTHKKG